MNSMSREAEARSYPSLAEIVNPENRSLRVYYPGSGGDLLSPVLTTNSDRFVYVDVCKLTEGYGHPDWTHLSRLEEEERILGVELDIQNNGQTARINFSYKHRQDSTPRQRDIVYYANDALIFWPPELDDGYDVLITRGETPSFDSHDVQMRQLGKKLVVGGFYISDRKISWHLLPEWMGFREIPNDVVFPCDNARLYRKDRQESLELLSLLFQFEDVFSDLNSFVRGGHSYTLFQNIDPEEALQIQQQYEKPVDPEAFKRNWEQMLEELKNDFGEKLLQKICVTSQIFRQLPTNVQESLKHRLPELQPTTYEFFREFEND